MRVGFVGLGKLGMPTAFAMSIKGHDVMGYDVDPAKMRTDVFPHQEVGPDGEPSLEPLLARSTLRFGSLNDVVRHAEILFVAVQTPHEPLYEGVTRLPDERVDFDYTWIKDAIGSISESVASLGEDRIVVIISTVLPGTTRRELRPLINDHVKLCYNPFFIAMGSTIQDFLHPEFVLLGVRDATAADAARAFYRTLHDRPVYETSIENAELLKVAYNTYISMKIAFANTVMEISHKIPGCDADEITGGLALATERLLSPKYLRGGMGDGGGCHPRDNIALSWLARELDLSHDWFESVMVCRERQTDWLADLVEEQLERFDAPEPKVGIYGRSFKEGTNLTVGSPATLLANILRERGVEVELWDPYVDEGECPFTEAGVYFVATNHADFAAEDWRFPEGSIVLDPWRYVPQRDGVEVIPVGVGASLDAELAAVVRDAAGADAATA